MGELKGGRSHYKCDVYWFVAVTSVITIGFTGDSPEDNVSNEKGNFNFCRSDTLKCYGIGKIQPLKKCLLQHSVELMQMQTVIQ